ncbi:MAG TPA: glycoside hydrolase family 2 TIM barrel-domain containing protein [Sediminibacterium sp.]|nr:glycoside hydrolase family 2 TIM barrel-domain containing protein [Sediminibacterium sp.]
MSVAIPAYLLSQIPQDAARIAGHIYLDSRAEHQGTTDWQMCRADSVTANAEWISTTDYRPDAHWQTAVVPGTVLYSLVRNGVYPDPYYGLNNQLAQHRIPDIAQAGRAFYTYWFRTRFLTPASFRNKTVWLQLDGINYRAEVWLNSHLVTTINGMFHDTKVDVTDFVHADAENVLAIKVLPVDIPGTNQPKPWRPTGENKNGGDGNIGLNTTMLMSVGWDFTFKDGIRDRNTGIWKSVSLFATGPVVLRHPFVQSVLTHPAYDTARETVSVEVANASMRTVRCVLKGAIPETGASFETAVTLVRSERKLVRFTSADFSQLVFAQPRLWWPRNKGAQALYTLSLKVYTDGQLSDSLNTRFGIREIYTDRNAPDSSKNFYVNGRKIFIRGANWIPEAMLRADDNRMYTELRYTRQAGVNMLRLWGGGIVESDYFYQLCDEMGLLVWQEFWLTGDTKHPQDTDQYFDNLHAAVMRIRNHPSLIFYVAANEGTEVPGTQERLQDWDGTRPYQTQSETDGVHDGSPYQQVNPMQHYENTASARGSRIDGFNPEYGAPSFPVAESAKELMDSADLWPINKTVWDYLDGNGFHGMSTTFTQLVKAYGTPSTIDAYAKQAQLVNAMNAKAIWESWNENKFGYGKRYCSGLLFWYLNSPNPQVCARMWDWSLQPTSALYHTQHALEPLHVQYDYLSNNVSVYNDYWKNFVHLRLSAAIYDLHSRKIFDTSIPLPLLGADTVMNNLATLQFPANKSTVYFIHLQIKDASGSIVSDSWYWRSMQSYEGAKTMTGPATGGFASLRDMPATKLAVSFEKTDGDYRIHLKNTGKQLAFFTEIECMDQQHHLIRPLFYSDNFITLLPGETRMIKLETLSGKPMPAGARLLVRGWNTETQLIDISKITVYAP